MLLNIGKWRLLFLIAMICLCGAIVLLLVSMKNEVLIAANVSVIDGIHTENSENTLNMIMGPSSAPRNLDAGELTILTIDYSSKIPIEAIINNKPGYEEYYRMITHIDSELRERFEYAFYGEKGFYLSTIPIEYFDSYEMKMHDCVQVVLFSEDFKNAAAHTFFYVGDKLESNFQFGSFYEVEYMKSSPDELYIFLFNNGMLMLDSNNDIHLWSNRRQYNIEVYGDYYHSLNYEKLGVSYSMLTDSKNLIWFEFDKQ